MARLQRIGFWLTVIGTHVQLATDRDRSTGDAAQADRDFADQLRSLFDQGLRLAIGMLNDQQEAEDAVQEALIVAWRKGRSIKEPEKLGSWFSGVVANQCRNARRDSWFSRVVLGLPENLPTRSEESGAVMGEDLRSAVARLPYKDRLVVVLYFYLDMPLEKVAVSTGASVSATRARLYRAIKRLRPGIDIEEELT